MEATKRGSRKRRNISGTYFRKQMIYLSDTLTGREVPIAVVPKKWPNDSFGDASEVNVLRVG